ncbi:hypothetical protein [uncultured Microscilla sp.]|uniref:hypothetical protein n=1 Tax=uncultured Microscilla sp. TaxID=432653 RepID=UPI002637448E|nr:hypothetical protein [uncultured Microscilla sp.]
MKPTELVELPSFIKAPSKQIAIDEQIDNDLLKAACEKMPNEEWEKLNDCAVEFIGKQLLTENDRLALHQNVDSFLQQMDKRYPK